MHVNLYALSWMPDMLVWFMESVVNAVGSFMPSAHDTRPDDAMQDAAYLNRDGESEKVFLRALDENHAILTKVSRSYSNRRVDREDLYSEIVYQLWKAYPTYNGDSKLSTWMYTIALRTAIMPFRHVRLAEELQGDIPDVADDEASDPDNRLFLIIHLLGRFERAALALMMEGYTQREIATMLSMSEWAVNKRLSRARKIVREYQTKTH